MSTLIYVNERQYIFTRYEYICYGTMSKYKVEKSLKIILRKQAIEKGLTKYFTGKPCKYGHIRERDTITGVCVGCNTEAIKKRRKKILEIMEQKRK